jgi:hypothetical protein
VNGPGRIRVRVRRALIAAGEREITTSDALAYVYPRGGKLHIQQRRRVRAALDEICERVRLERRGRSFVLVWRPCGPVKGPEPRGKPSGRLWPKGGKYPAGWPPR